MSTKTPQIAGLESFLERLFYKSPISATREFEQTCPARLLREIQDLIHHQRAQIDAVDAERERRTLQLAQALGEAFLDPDAGPVCNTSWDDLIGSVEHLVEENDKLSMMAVAGSKAEA